MYHLDANEMHGKNAKQKSHKNAKCLFEQILEAKSHKIEGSVLVV